MLLNAIHSGFESFAFVVSSSTTEPWTFSEGDEHAQLELQQGKLLGRLKRRGLAPSSVLARMDGSQLRA